MTRPDGSMSDPDAATDGGGGLDSGGMDAAAGGDASVSDASDVPGDGGGAGNGATDGGMLDGGMPDAGEPDSGTTDSGSTDAGTTDCTTTVEPVLAVWTEDCVGVPDVLFCDEFEDGTLRNKWPDNQNPRGSTARTTEEFHAGAYAMRASSSGSTATAESMAVRGVRAFRHTKSGELWARYFQFVPTTAEITNMVSIGTISDASSEATPAGCTSGFGFSVSIYPEGTGLEIGSQLYHNPELEFPRDTWVCVRMHVVINDSGGLIEAFIGDTQIAQVDGLDTLPDLGYTSFVIGVEANDNQGAVTMYSDDVQLSTSPIGCE